MGDRVKIGRMVVLLLFLVACGRVPRSLPLPTITYPAQPQATSTTPPTSPPLLPTLAPLPLPANPTAVPLDKTDNQSDRAWQMGLAHTGVWLYDANSFIHPRALEVMGETAYLLDSGRVLRLNLGQPTPPETLLQAGAIIEDVPVLEPFDLASSGDMLYVLDRAGDVYRYDTTTAVWQLDRYDRPVRDVSSQYYVALTAQAGIRFLLETSYKFVQAYDDTGDRYAWLTGSAREVDMSVAGEFAYVLTQLSEQVGQVTKVEAAQRVQVEFVLEGELTRPRHIQTTPTTLYILDQAGYRLQAFDPATGERQTDWQFTQPISTFWADDTQLILVGRDTFYFVNQPERTATISGGLPLTSGQPHDVYTLTTLQGLFSPIAYSTVALREFQLPGAPRHYRLGVHEGMDFYKAIGTPVLAVADGTIIRADTTYITPTERLFGQMRDTVFIAGLTPPEALDFYRGRQVWLQLDNGWVARYAHLSEIPDGIEVGVQVMAGQMIGKVGNSGSPITQQNPEGDVHLHFELWLGTHYLGQFLHPIEVEEWLGIIFRRP